MKKFEILFKFAYIGRYLTENTGTARYLAVQTGTGRYLTGTISDINVYRFLTGTVRYARYRPVRYGIYNYDLDLISQPVLIYNQSAQSTIKHVCKTCLINMLKYKYLLGLSIRFVIIKTLHPIR